MMNHRRNYRLCFQPNNLVTILSLGLFIWILQGPNPLSAQSSLTPLDLAKIESVSQSVVSPDGSQIAYTRSVPADPYEENAAASSHLYVFDIETETSRPFYTTGSVSSVQFRPKHQALTFLTQREGDDRTALYQMPLDGGAPVKLYSQKESIRSYAWHPSGNKLALTVSVPTESSSTPLPYEADVFEENMSSGRAMIASVDGDDDENVEIALEGAIYMLSWSPKGDQLAVSAAPTTSVDDYYMAQKVYIINPTDGSVSASVDNEGKLGQIVWSPDGQKLALRAGKDINDPIDGRILTVSVRGGQPQLINPGFKGKYEQISWQDDNRIYYAASRSTSVELGSLAPNGKDREVLWSSNSHGLKSFSQPSANGPIAFVGDAPQHPAELFLLKNGESERLTHHNQWLQDRKLGTQKTISYEARDGEWTIDGILILPTNYSEDRSYPLITVVHGGPESHYSNGWLTAYSMPGQVAASKGYAVFYPNYRGSTGRGSEYLYSSQGDLAGSEYDDIVDGVDHLIQKGIADENRIGVTGGSYGGYASAWMATRYSDRFAASVMFVGISNNLSKWGTSDIPDELYYVHTRERMWESDAKRMDYLKRSPIYHVDNANTPLLIMHGAEDTRVHPSQSLELFRHMKVRQPEVPLRLVYYPGEGHGNRKAAARLDYNYRMLEWFDTYLKTGDRSAAKPSWDVSIPARE